MGDVWVIQPLIGHVLFYQTFHTPSTPSVGASDLGADGEVRERKNEREGKERDGEKIEKKKY